MRSAGSYHYTMPMIDTPCVFLERLEARNYAPHTFQDISFHSANIVLILESLWPVIAFHYYSWDLLDLHSQNHRFLLLQENGDIIPCNIIARVNPSKQVAQIVCGFSGDKTTQLLVEHRKP